MIVYAIVVSLLVGTVIGLIIADRILVWRMRQLNPKLMDEIDKDIEAQRRRHAKH